jgi:glyoxylase-like metal-dependent hydrolase (beta-lactamase superfamily II)
MERLSAGFLVTGPQPALVEAGSQSSTGAVLAALAEAGVGARDLRWVVVSHVHLDHAGAAGDIAAAFPNATVVVHEQGAPHLADPSRLIASAARVYGPLLDSLYGRMLPVPSDRLLAAGDGLTIDVGGGRRLRMVDSPGHARHHQAILDEATGTLMVGDAVGVLLPDLGVLRPATPPPDFDLELMVSSLRRFRELRPARMVLTHFGPVGDVEATLAQAESEVRRWVDLARRVTGEHPDAGVDGVAAAFTRAFAASPADTPAAGRLDILNGIHGNAAGIVRYLNRQAATRPPAE